MTAIVQDLGLLVAAAVLLAFVAALARTRQILLPMAVALDFFTAASLLRLAGPATWSSLAAAALTITIRQLGSRSLRAAASGGRRSRITCRRRLD